MPTTRSLAAALKMARKARGLSQEAFSEVSSRTYLSTLERGMKSPTLSKVAAICRVLDIHPLTLLSLSYTGGNPTDLERLISRVRSESAALAGSSKK
jgi:transcriptional regulator with XRE-family HTH domain